MYNIKDINLEKNKNWKELSSFISMFEQLEDLGFSLYAVPNGIESFPDERMERVKLFIAPKDMAEHESFSHIFRFHTIKSNRASDIACNIEDAIIEKFGIDEDDLDEKDYEDFFDNKEEFKDVVDRSIIRYWRELFLHLFNIYPGKRLWLDFSVGEERYHAIIEK